jgi:hypothetical protein
MEVDEKINMDFVRFEEVPKVKMIGQKLPGYFL